jgi:hypothetical protein
MDAAYQMRNNADYSKRALAGAQAYDIERLISNRWLPLLKNMEEKLANKPTDKKVSSILGGLRHA